MNGIGGSTIAEAMNTLTFQEFMTWTKFRGKRGSLHTGMRVEKAVAVLASMYANAHSSKDQRFTVYDFMPHEPEPEVSLEDAMEKWA